MGPFVPVGPLPLPIGVVIALEVSVTDVQAEALLPDFIAMIKYFEFCPVRYIDWDTTGIDWQLHIWGIARFLSLDLPLRSISRVFFDFMTPAGVDRISGEMNIRRRGPLDRVKSVLYLFNIILSDDYWFIQMGIFECICGSMFPRYSMNLLKSRVLLLSAYHSTDHHGGGNGYIFTHFLLNILEFNQCFVNYIYLF